MGKNTLIGTGIGPLLSIFEIILAGSDQASLKMSDPRACTSEVAADGDDNDDSSRLHIMCSD